MRLAANRHHPAHSTNCCRFDGRLQRGLISHIVGDQDTVERLQARLSGKLGVRGPVHVQEALRFVQQQHTIVDLVEHQ